MIPTPDIGDLANITVRDLADLEAELGKPIGAVFEKLAGGDMSGLNVETLAGLLWLRLRKDDPDLTLEGSTTSTSGAQNQGPKRFGGPDSVTGLVVRLSRVWGCSPVALRDLNLAEMTAMGEVLRAESRAR